MKFDEIITKHAFLLVFFMGFFALWNTHHHPVNTIALILGVIFVWLHLENRLPLFRQLLLAGIIFILLFSPMIRYSLLNQDERISDVPPAIKAAAQYVIAEKNPYSESYYGTILEKSIPYNTAFWTSTGRAYLSMESFVYMPAIFLAAVPFELAFPGQSYGWLAIIILVGCLCMLIFLGPKHIEWMLVLLFLNPIIFTSSTHLHSVDFLLLFFLLVFMVGMKNRLPWMSGIALGLAFSTKLYVLIVVPFLVYYLWKHHQKKTLAFAAATVLLIQGPFVIWNPMAYLQDVVFLAVGTGTASLSIWKQFYGIFPTLVNLNLISAELGWIALPFMIGVFGIVFWQFIKKTGSLSRTFGYGCICIIGVFMFSKHFTDNYLTFPFFILILYFLSLDSPFYEIEKNVSPPTLSVLEKNQGQ